MSKIDANVTMPLTVALLTERPEARRDVLIALAHRGQETTRKLAALIAEAADFQTCRTTRYAAHASLKAAVETHTKRLQGLYQQVQHTAGCTHNLRKLARKLKIQDPIFAELHLVTGQTAVLLKAIMDAWEVESVRLLQQHEVETIRFGNSVPALKTVLHALLKAEREASAPPPAETTPETAPEADALAA